MKYSGVSALGRGRHLRLQFLKTRQILLLLRI